MKTRLLSKAIKAEDRVQVEALLGEGTDPNGVIWREATDFNGATKNYATGFLAEAAREGNLEIAELLLQHGAEVNSKGEEMSPLSEAACNGHIKVVKLLLQHGADIEPEGQQSPLAWASYSGSDGLPIMKLLIARGANVNARFERGATVMSVARFHCGEEAVALLKKHGAHR